MFFLSCVCGAVVVSRAFEIHCAKEIQNQVAAIFHPLKTWKKTAALRRAVSTRQLRALGGKAFCLLFNLRSSLYGNKHRGYISFLTHIVSISTRPCTSTPNVAALDLSTRRRPTPATCCLKQEPEARPTKQTLHRWNVSRAPLRQPTYFEAHGKPWVYQQLASPDLRNESRTTKMSKYDIPTVFLRAVLHTSARTVRCGWHDVLLSKIVGGFAVGGAVLQLLPA